MILCALWQKQIPDRMLVFPKINLMRYYHKKSTKIIY
jgi:hypothetical protein